MIYDLLVSFGPKVLALSVLAVVALLFMRRSVASRRHAVAIACLLAILIVPLMGIMLPSRQVATPAAIAEPLRYLASPTQAAHLDLPAQNIGATSQEIGPGIEFSISQVVTILWVAGALVLLGRMAFGFAQVSRWLKRSQALTGTDARVCDEVPVPMTAWLGRPAILLPSEAADWPQERLDHVLQHERAHGARLDWLWNVLAYLTCAIYWPLPTVWLIKRIARDSSERACDDQVLRSGVVASAYAEDLLTIARDVSRSWPIPALPMAHKPEVRSRIEHVLDVKAKRSKAGFMTPISAGIAATLFAVPISVVALKAPNMVQDPGGGAYYNPGSVNGAPSNDFVAKLADGRQVELVQIQQQINGRNVAWKGDGALIKNAKSYGDPGTSSSTEVRQLVVLRIKSTAALDGNKFSWSSLNIPGVFIPGNPGSADDDYMVTAVTAKSVLTSASGWQTLLINTRQPAAMAKCHFNFLVSEALYVDEGTIAINADGSATTDSKLLKNIKFNPHTNYDPYAPYNKGYGYGNGSLLTFNIQLTPRLPFAVELTAYDEDGSTVKYHTFNSTENLDGLRKEEWFYKEGIPARFEVRTGLAQAVSFLDVELKPKA